MRASTAASSKRRKFQSPCPASQFTTPCPRDEMIASFDDQAGRAVMMLHILSCRPSDATSSLSADGWPSKPQRPASQRVDFYAISAHRCRRAFLCHFFHFDALSFKIWGRCGEQKTFATMIGCSADAMTIYFRRRYWSCPRSLPRQPARYLCRGRHV